MSEIIGGLLNLAQAALGGYGLQFSISSIQKLRKYEDVTQRAAKYSSKVAKDLDKIRTTQAAGAVAVSFMFYLMPSLRVFTFRRVNTFLLGSYLSAPLPSYSRSSSGADWSVARYLASIVIIRCSYSFQRSDGWRNGSRSSSTSRSSLFQHSSCSARPKTYRQFLGDTTESAATRFG